MPFASTMVISRSRSELGIPRNRRLSTDRSTTTPPGIQHSKHIGHVDATIRVDILDTECRADLRHAQSILALPDTGRIHTGRQCRDDAVLLKTTGATDTAIIANVDQTDILPLNTVPMEPTCDEPRPAFDTSDFRTVDNRFIEIEPAVLEDRRPTSTEASTSFIRLVVENQTVADHGTRVDQQQSTAAASMPFVPGHARTAATGNREPDQARIRPLSHPHRDNGTA